MCWWKSKGKYKARRFPAKSGIGIEELLVLLEAEIARPESQWTAGPSAPLLKPRSTKAAAA
jgi:hypothetical protein